MDRGVAIVTTAILPAVARLSDPSRRIEVFEEIEGHFSLQAKLSVTIAGLSGFYMTYRLDAWDRFGDTQFWWMPAMVFVWAVFSFVLFIAEPAFLHARFHRRARRDPAGTFALVRRTHWILAQRDHNRGGGVGRPRRPVLSDTVRFSSRFARAADQLSIDRLATAGAERP